MTPDNGAASAKITLVDLTTGSPLTPPEARRVASALEANIARALKGKQEIVELSLAVVSAATAWSSFQPLASRTQVSSWRMPALDFV